MKFVTGIKYFLTGIKPPYKGSEVELNPAYVEEFWFMENIETMFISGYIKMNDVGGFFEKLPLTGTEGFRVIIEQEAKNTNDSTKSINTIKVLEFDIYNVATPEFRSLNQTTFEFTLVEKGSFEFTGSMYSKSYSKYKISQIVTDICKNQLKIVPESFVVENTNDIYDYIIPYWTPIVTLRDLLSKSRRAVSPFEGGFLFFSTTETNSTKKPIKKFVSFASLIEQKPDTSDEKRWYFKKSKMNIFHINNIVEAKSNEYVKMDNLEGALSGKKFFGIDFTTSRKPSIVKQTYPEFMKKSKVMGKFAYTTDGMDEGFGDVRFFGLKEDIVKSEIDYAYRLRVEGLNKRTVLLNGLLERSCGQMIFLEQATDNASENYNIQESGKWLIKHITHHFTGNEYNQKIILIRDSVPDTESKGLLRI